MSGSQWIVSTSLICYLPPHWHFHHLLCHQEQNRWLMPTFLTINCLPLWCHKGHLCLCQVSVITVRQLFVLRPAIASQPPCSCPLPNPWKVHQGITFSWNLKSSYFFLGGHKQRDKRDVFLGEKKQSPPKRWSVGLLNSEPCLWNLNELSWGRSIRMKDLGTPP